MIIFHNCQSVIKFKKLLTAQTVYGMCCAAGYAGWFAFGFV